MTNSSLPDAVFQRTKKLEAPASVTSPSGPKSQRT